MNQKISQILIVSITPYFLEKEGVWFKEHLDEIINSAKNQPFFQDNTLLLEISKQSPISQLLRKLDELGYEKVFKVQDLGEFSHKGGVIDIFPINSDQAFRLDFLGNTIESIRPIGETTKNPEKLRTILQKRLKSQKIFSDIKNIRQGDFIVHLDHGVARFCGIETLQIANNEPKTDLESSRYYKLEYAKGDSLYVPIGLEGKLSRYVGFSDPAISRLGSALWQKTKKQAKEQVEKMAQDLLSLYAKKEAATRKPYVKDNDLESELRAGFLYQETPDQIQAIEDIKNDLLKEAPMDRIVCGDVGFGKTEVAMRASLLAAANNCQVAIMCPTTILANQHYHAFKSRFQNIPVCIRLLSRLQLKKEQIKILQEIREGKADIVIGTHRMLSDDIAFKKLQLLIIDDEQRFGVKQKEKLRQKNPALDILSLSATPIPRTMYLALSSFKNISLMQTPPQGRSSIETHFLAYDKKTIRESILHELGRHGQVYFLHNRVASIEAVKSSLKKLVPEAKFSSIHGRMDERKLVSAMDRFRQGDIDVLVATTIIENGLDLPNVNTIIVEDASRLGLSQAYQIRGRVGRSSIKGIAYFFWQKKLTPLAKERMKAIKEADELGSGYRIALKDLELRGAGNILGREQSGSVNKVGLNLYCQMLAESIEKLRN